MQVSAVQASHFWLVAETKLTLKPGADVGNVFGLRAAGRRSAKLDRMSY